MSSDTLRDRDRRVLCFGDSNTWGYAPIDRVRYAKDVRWTGRLAAKLGAGYDVVSEGLCGRTAVIPDPVMRLGDAMTDLETSLRTHIPIRHVVLMLGTNDFKTRFGLSEYSIADGIGHLARRVIRSEEVFGSRPNRLILVAPLVVRLDGALDPSESDKRLLEFDGAPEVSRKLPPLLKSLADDLGCDFLDPNDQLRSSERHGIHWEADTHQSFADLIVARILTR